MMILSYYTINNVIVSIIIIIIFLIIYSCINNGMGWRHESDPIAFNLVFENDTAPIPWYAIDWKGRDRSSRVQVSFRHCASASDVIHRQ